MPKIEKASQVLAFHPLLFFFYFHVCARGMHVCTCVFMCVDACICVDGCACMCRYIAEARD